MSRLDESMYPNIDVCDCDNRFARSDSLTSLRINEDFVAFLVITRLFTIIADAPANVVKDL